MISIDEAIIAVAMGILIVGITVYQNGAQMKNTKRQLKVHAGQSPSEPFIHKCKSSSSSSSSTAATEDSQETCSLEDYSETSESSSDDYAVYFQGQCVYRDEDNKSCKPAYVPPGCCVSVVPDQYLHYFKSRSKAEKRWAATIQWRLEEGIHNIHRKPHPNFEIIKDAYVHCLHGISRQGLPVIYEKTGENKLKDVLGVKVSVKQMTYHYAYFWEYVLNCACTHHEVSSMRSKHKVDSKEIGAIVIMDLEGLGMCTISGNVLKYLKSAGDLGADYFPGNVAKALMINAPSWFAGTWSYIKNILPKSVQESTQIYGSNYIDALREFIDDDQIPAEYGGSSSFKFGSHPLETDLIEVVMKGNSPTAWIKDEIVVNKTSKIAVAPMNNSNFLQPNKQKKKKSKTLRRLYRALKRNPFKTKRKMATVNEY